MNTDILRAGLAMSVSYYPPMAFKRIGGVVLACALGVAACGGSHAESQAVSDVRQACTTLLHMGSQLKGAAATHPVQGNAVNQGLQSADSNAQSAARLDSTQWSGFASDVEQLATTLRAGKSADTGLINRLSAACQPYSKG
jgi:hypothetical protein